MRFGKYFDNIRACQKEANMLFNTRIFTATLGGKNFLTRQQVFSNWGAKDGGAADLENILQSYSRDTLTQRKSPLRFRNFCL